jgi:hypothetical protein
MLLEKECRRRCEALIWVGRLVRMFLQGLPFLIVKERRYIEGCSACGVEVSLNCLWNITPHCPASAERFAITTLFFTCLPRCLLCNFCIGIQKSMKEGWITVCWHQEKDVPSGKERASSTSELRSGGLIHLKHY